MNPEVIHQACKTITSDVNHNLTCRLGTTHIHTDTIHTIVDQLEVIQTEITKPVFEAQPNVPFILGETADFRVVCLRRDPAAYPSGFDLTLERCEKDALHHVRWVHVSHLFVDPRRNESILTYILLDKLVGGTT